MNGMARNTMKKRFSLKDQLFNVDTVTYLGVLFRKTASGFDSTQFVADVMKKLLNLELKERIVWIAEVLEQHLPKDFKKASQIITKALPPPLDPTKTDDDFGSFIFAPLGEYVVRNGLLKENLAVSLSVLYELTQRFSMEDAMRAFLHEFPKETLAIYKKWMKDRNYHVRRLVSESTRPFLPWSKRIGIGTKTPVVFLNTLYADKTRYVTRSVANHLNDITKEDPLLVLETLVRWRKEGKQDVQELEWMTKHALRTLIKRGNTEALKFLGYQVDIPITVEQFSLKSKKIVGGNTFTFSFDLTAREDMLLCIDYSIDFLKANGAHKPKVFSIKKTPLKKDQRISLLKNHRLLADATTFTLYKGVHRVTLQINGKKYDSLEFIVH